MTEKSEKVNESQIDFLGLPAEEGRPCTHVDCEKMRDTYGTGYIPHSGMERFRCPRCGCTQFKCYPQTAPADRSKTWTWEYVCAECGQGMGLTVKGDE